MKRRLLAPLACVVLCGALLQQSDPRISIDVRDTPLVDVIALLANESGVNVVADRSIEDERITVHLTHVRALEALAILAASNGLQIQHRGSVIILSAWDAIQRRGSGQGFGESTAVLRLVHAMPDVLAKELLLLLPTGSIVVPDPRINALVITGSQGVLSQARELISELDVVPITAPAAQRVRSYPLRFTHADDVVKEMKGALPDGVFIPDEQQNAVLVVGAEDAQASARKAIEAIDVAGPQVLFEVRVADVTPVNDQSDVGLEFGGLDLQGQPLAGGTAYAFASGTISVNVQLNALVTKGHAQILATPRLVTLNGKEADLLIGETYPVVYNTSVLGGQNVQFVDIGVKLRLTPIIGPDGSVTAELHPEYSELEGFTSTGYPIIANRKIDSTLRVKNGETIVLGGLLRDTSTETVQQVPWLAQIPVLGKLFQDKQTSRERDEIVFLITPHIVDQNAAPPQ